MGAYKYMVGDFASSAIDRNFMLKLESFETHCHPPKGGMSHLMNSLSGSKEKSHEFFKSQLFPISLKGTNNNMRSCCASEGSQVSSLVVLHLVSNITL